MEALQTSLLPMVEAFGTRNQEQFLGEVITPVWPVASDIFGGLQLVGADSTGTPTPAASLASTAVRVEQDTYVTGIWIVEPAVTVVSTCLILDVFIQRIGVTGTPFQMTPLRLQPYGTSEAIGRAPAVASQVRTYPLTDLPWGSLLRAGDVISATYVNTGGAAFTTGLTIAYRGFKGPPR